MSLPTESESGQALRELFATMVAIQCPRSEAKIDVPWMLGHIDPLNETARGIPPISDTARRVLSQQPEDSGVGVMERSTIIYRTVFESHITAMRTALLGDWMNGIKPKDGTLETGAQYRWIAGSRSGPVYEITLPFLPGDTPRVYVGKFYITNDHEEIAEGGPDDQARHLGALVIGACIPEAIHLVAHSFRDKCIIMEEAPVDESILNLDRKHPDTGFIFTEENIRELIRITKVFLNEGLYIDFWKTNIYLHEGKFTIIDFQAVSYMHDDFIVSSFHELIGLINAHRGRSPLIPEILEKWLTLIAEDSSVPAVDIETLRAKTVADPNFKYQVSR